MLSVEIVPRRELVAVNNLDPLNIVEVSELVFVYAAARAKRRIPLIEVVAVAVVSLKLPMF